MPPASIRRARRPGIRRVLPRSARSTFLGRPARPCGLLHGLEPAEADPLPLDVYVRQPFPARLDEAHALHSARVVGSGLRAELPQLGAVDAVRVQVIAGCGESKAAARSRGLGLRRSAAAVTSTTLPHWHSQRQTTEVPFTSPVGSMALRSPNLWPEMSICSRALAGHSHSDAPFATGCPGLAPALTPRSIS